MPPFQELIHNVSHSTTSSSGQPPNTVSWQSAFWPIVACTMAGMLQSTGRVLGGSHSDSFILRSSPLICIADALASLIKLVVLQAKGCSFRTAARHVWYERFEESTIGYHDTAIEGSVGPSTTMSPALQPHKKSTPTSAILGTAHKTEDDHMYSGALPMTDIAENNPIENISIRSTDSTATTPTPDSMVTTPTPSSTISVSMIGASAEVLGDEACPHVNVKSLTQHIEHGSCLEAPSSIQLASRAAEDTATQTSPPSGANEHIIKLPGSEIDRAWRYTMAAFAMGAFPQFVKVFCMKGIPLTQILVAFCIVSFIVFELFRLIAGPAGAVDLRPLPIITKAKESLVELQFFLLGLGLLATILGLGLTSLRLSLAGDKSLTFAFALELPSLTIIVVLLVEQTVATLLTELPSVLARSTITGCLGKRTSVPKSRGMFSTGIFPQPGNVSSTSTTHQILEVLALPRSTSCLHLILIILFIPFVLVSVLLTALSQRKIGLNDTGGHLIMILSSLTPGASVLAALHIFFRVGFMGSLSTKPRTFFALQGTLSEFLSAAFLVVNFLTTLSCYTWHLTGEPFYEGTYKPSWTEYLG